jgi:hypothetical protein
VWGLPENALADVTQMMKVDDNIVILSLFIANEIAIRHGKSG